MNPTPAILAENLVKRYPVVRGFREALTYKFSFVSSFAGILLPVTCALDGMRKCLLASAGFAEVLPDIAALAVFNIILLPASLPVFSAPLIC